MKKYTTYEQPYAGQTFTESEMMNIYTKDADKSEYPEFTDWLHDMLKSGVFEKDDSIMTLELSRNNVCDISMALLDLIHVFRHEINDENTSETRREIAKASLKKWERLRDEVKRQLKEFDND